MCTGRGIEGAIWKLLGHRSAPRRLPVLRPRERRASVWRLASHAPSFDLSGDAEAPPERGRFEGCESACKPDPVVDGHLSGTYIAASLVRSTRDVAGGPPCPCSTLLRMGFAKPARSPGPLVVSYTTVSPLPVPRDVRFPGPSAVCSLLHCPSGRPAWVLPSILPCGVRTFLDPKAAAASRTRTRNASGSSLVPAQESTAGEFPAVLV